MGSKYFSRTMRVAVITLLVVLACTAFSFGAERGTDVSSPAKGNRMTFVTGTYEKANVTDVVNLINSYRKEACNNGYPDPRDSTRSLTPGDYVPIKWAGDLEWIAQTRAAEGAVYQSHSRPNGTMCFTCEYNGTSTWGENLAWNGSGLIYGIKQWYGEKNDWVNQNLEYETGHYTQMINPGILFVGIGCFTPDANTWTCVAGEFSWQSDLGTASKGVSGKYDQGMEVMISNMTKRSYQVQPR